MPILHNSQRACHYAQTQEIIKTPTRQPEYDIESKILLSYQLHKTYKRVQTVAVPVSVSTWPHLSFFFIAFLTIFLI